MKSLIFIFLDKIARQIVYAPQSNVLYVTTYKTLKNTSVWVVSPSLKIIGSTEIGDQEGVWLDTDGINGYYATTSGLVFGKVDPSGNQAEKSAG